MAKKIVVGLSVAATLLGTVMLAVFGKVKSSRMSFEGGRANIEWVEYSLQNWYYFAMIGVAVLAIIFVALSLKKHYFAWIGAVAAILAPVLGYLAGEEKLAFVKDLHGDLLDGNSDTINIFNDSVTVGFWILVVAAVLATANAFVKSSSTRSSKGQDA